MMANLVFNPTALTPKNNPGTEYQFTATATVEKNYTVTVPPYMQIRIAGIEYQDVVAVTIGTGGVTFSVRMTTSEIYDSGITFADQSLTYEDEILSVLFDIKNLLLIRLGEGYGDYYKKGIKKSFNVYNQDNTATIPDAYVYESATATFRLAVSADIGAKPLYKLASKDHWVQVYTELYDAWADTIDIKLDSSAIKGATLEVYVKAGVSLASMKTSWSIDSKTIMVDGPTNALGDRARTGSFSNDDVRFDGSQATIDLAFRPDVRDPQSIKFRLKAILNESGIDDFVINSIRILPSNVIYIGGIDG